MPLRVLVGTAIIALAAPVVTSAQQAVTVLHWFYGAPDGDSPLAPLIQARDGNFYGTTANGGAGDVGTVFKMTPDGAVTVLHSFVAETEGAGPESGLIQAPDGNFYGTTTGRNTYPTSSVQFVQSSSGTVFKMTAAGIVTVLHWFGGQDGAVANGLIQATDGSLYGTTAYGGSSNKGTVFKISPDGDFTVLHAFAGAPDGDAPHASLVQATDGNFYGTTYLGGTRGEGTIFKITPGGTVTVLHSFGGLLLYPFGSSVGVFPEAALIQATDGNFYGTTSTYGSGGGATGAGTVFKMSAAGDFTELYSFAGGYIDPIDGQPRQGLGSRAALIQATDGNFYGTLDGTNSVPNGAVFKMTPTGTVTIVQRFDDATRVARPEAPLIQATDGNLYGTTYTGFPPNRGVIFRLPIASAATAVSSLVLKPATVVGGQMVQAVVTLNGAATAPFVVSLSSANPSLATVPATVTVQTGSTSAEFTVRTSRANVATDTTITATAVGAMLAQLLTVTGPPTSGASPFGAVDTPLSFATVTGSIAVTGWSLDANGVSGVKIYRNCLPGIDNPAACQTVNGTSVAFIGDATFIEGARPDIEALYPLYPNSVRAGWGYLLLTNMLPHVTAPTNPTAGGQGPITLFIYATDIEGNRVLLGQRVLALDNDHGARPFGAIDTPTQGGTASGIAPNYGWALTQGTAIIPTNGSTISVVIDGVAKGTVTYNLCRGTSVGVGGCSDDIATLFPNFTNIKNGIGAIGVFLLDTTTLANGVHTIAWGVTDNQGRVDGIGSRYFNVLNTAPSVTANGTALRTAAIPSGGAVSSQNMLAARSASLGTPSELAWRSVSDADMDGRAGFDIDAPLEAIHTDTTGVHHVRVPELGRLELLVGRETTAGYLRTNGTLQALPVGSHLDTATGVFTWVPGPGFIGIYDLVFFKGMTQVLFAVTIVPKPGQTSGLMRGWIDLPTASQTVSSTFTVAGWALDSAAWHGAGVGAVHVWAQRRDVPASSEIFLGAATIGGVRPDVATVYGPQFDRAGWSLTGSGLAPGIYDVTAYFWSTRTGEFEDARTTTVTVR